MTDRQSLLIELGCEELPPGALDALAAAFAGSICASLEKFGLLADVARARRYATPRRLAVHVPAVAPEQPDQHVERRGPAVAAGLDDAGQPTKALQGFARSCGVEPDALEKMQTDKGEWFVYRAVQPGQRLDELLPGVLADAVKALPIPRPMRWGDHDYRFVRPVHWLVALHGEQLLDVELLGLRSGRQSAGHRFHHPQPVAIASADAWLDALRAACVLADPAERRARIEARCAELADSQDVTLSPMDREGLFGELVNITEWPQPILCRFDESYLKLPGEVLRTTMEEDQRFLATAERDTAGGPGELGAWFIGVANIESRDPAQIRQGYERVIRPRFADAWFFYEADLKTPLADLQPMLAKSTYQKQLGSVWDKCLRVAEMARVVGNRVGVDAGLATHAATLAKCDLMTRMVGEFPSLQGIMGRCYAREQGEPTEVADALDAFYQPRHAGEPIAAQPLARVLAVAERLDTLAGIFAVGLKPSGNKDPFALRRAALGLARTLIEGDMDLDLGALFIETLQLLPEAALRAGGAKAADDKDDSFDAGARRRALLDELLAFVRDRLRGYYAEQGFAATQFEAVAALRPASLVDFDHRLRAVAEFARLPEASALAAANKRVGNILRKQGDFDVAQARVDEALFEDEAERTLAAAIDEHGARSRAHHADGDYTAALKALAALQPDVDRFFDEVLVMAEQTELRTNRLALLASLQGRFMAVADVAKLDT